MQSKAKTVEAYLAELPPERREAIEAVRRVIRKNLGKGFEEGMQYGMIGYYVPHSVYPPGYHCDPSQPLPFAGLASQKNHMSLYLMGIYGSSQQRETFEREWQEAAAAGKAGKLDMGKGCVRFKKLEQVPLEVVGRAIRRVRLREFVSGYEAGIGAARTARKKAPSVKERSASANPRSAGPALKRAAKEKVAKKPAAKKKAIKKKTAKKASTPKNPTQKNPTQKQTARKKPADSRRSGPSRRAK